MSAPLGPGAQARGTGGWGARPVRGRRPRWAAPVLLGLLVLLAVEVWLLVLLADVITSVGMLVLLVVETLAGVAVLRRAGRRALGALRSAGQAFPGAFPGGAAPPGPGPVGDAVLVGAGGALLVLPGLLSDVLALLCLLPPTRVLVRRLGARLLRARLRRALGRAGLDLGAAGRARVVDGDVVDAEVVDGEVVPEDPPGPRRTLGWPGDRRDRPAPPGGGG
ncbi:FxsA family protein [Kineococcus sp. SYSU DK018]|uniref:FxsA family protein n=1 Tax=Kineococcus sp. SYSU DK018 TaxID=3383139 RepID=UPI003D7CC8EE